MHGYCESGAGARLHKCFCLAVVVSGRITEELWVYSLLINLYNKSQSHYDEENERDDSTKDCIERILPFVLELYRDTEHILSSERVRDFIA